MAGSRSSWELAILAAVYADVGQLLLFSCMPTVQGWGFEVKVADVQGTYLDRIQRFCADYEVDTYLAHEVARHLQYVCRYPVFDGNEVQ